MMMDPRTAAGTRMSLKNSMAFLTWSAVVDSRDPPRSARAV